MKIILILLTLITLTSCSVEQRVKNYSYTNEYYYIDMMKFEVYKTKSGRKYIIVLNEKHTRYVRQYIK